MPTCELCENKFPVKQEIDGKVRNLQRRKYCLICSPFGSGNTRKLGQSPSKDKEVSRGEKYARWQKKARKHRKEKLVALAGGECIICGYNRCCTALDFHHKNEDSKADKSYGVAANGMLSKWSKLLDEIKKCVLLCSNCHREVHAGMHDELVQRWKQDYGNIAEMD